MEGWIKLYRQIEENEFYFDEPFTRTQAWIDLLLLACHKSTSLRIRGIKIDLKPGELCYSQLSLAQRWKRDRKTVNKFLNEFKNMQMVDIKISRLTTIITITNWEKYQGNDLVGDNKIHNKKDNRMDIKKDTNKNDKNVNNNIKDIRLFDEPNINSKYLTEKGIDYALVIENWNQNIREINLLNEHSKKQPCNIPEVKQLNDNRKKAIIHRFAEKGFEYDNILISIKNSDFLQGLTTKSNGHENWKFSFDTLFDSKTFYIRILEGNYKNGKTTTEIKHGNDLLEQNIKDAQDFIQSYPDNE